MHFLGHLVLALAIIIAAMIVAFAFRFTPVTERSFSYNIFNNNTEPTGEYIRSFDQ
jgi:hypothetical protein